MGRQSSPKTVGTQRLQRSAAFTLLELLVALAVSGAVALGVYAAVSVSADVAARGRDAVDGALKREAATAALRRWLEGAAVSSGDEPARFEGEDGTSLGLPSDELFFTTTDPWLLGDSGELTWIRLRVAAVDSGLVADYGAIRPDQVLKSGDRRRVSVLPQVRGMDFRYFVTLGDQRRWFSGWSSRVRLPRAVTLQFYTTGGDTLPRELRAPMLIKLAPQG